MPLERFLGFPYEQKEIELSTGDTLVLMSDGFVEMSDNENQTFGYAWVKGIVREAGTKSPKEIIHHLINAGKMWAKGRVQEDDVKFMVVQVK